jgi:steroid 5-alpha reductase family enzyme
VGVQVTDLAGSTNFIIIAIVSLVSRGASRTSTRGILITSLQCIWGARLCMFLFLRVMAWGHDNRFDDKRNNLVRFAIFWILQAVWVLIVSLPCLFVNAGDASLGAALHRNKEWSDIDSIGLALWIVGIVCETVGDQQKLWFKRDPKNAKTFCNCGLWSWSRHPNYFGEILLWWGMFAIALSEMRHTVKAGSVVLIAAGPLFTTLLLLFVSGMPILEISANKRFASNPEYVAWRAQTSPLIPLPPVLYRALPRLLKLLVLCELPLYAKGAKASLLSAESQ